MKWYDLFSWFYDGSLEHLYAPYRQRLICELGDLRGARVIDLACGTGQNWDLLVPAVGADGRVLGIDASAGMLKRAEQRIARNGWTQVQTRHADVTELSSAGHSDAMQPADLLLCTLGFTAFEDWEAQWAKALGWVRPGGRIAILDVTAKARTLHTTSVEVVARADLNRKVYELVERDCSNVQLIWLDADTKTFGGELYIAIGTVDE